MPLFQLFLIAIIQGITEFLPVSSSGHLVLVPNLTGLKDQGHVLDVAVHIGTLGAVMLYFRQDVSQMLTGVAHLFKGDTSSAAARLTLNLVLATIPVVIVGALFYVSGLSDQLRSVTVIGWTMLGFGVVLYWADQSGGETKSAEGWNPKDAAIMGLWQAVSLIPGTSRSGITITGGRKLGYGREDAARLAMLMSIPTIIASGVLLGGDVVARADAEMARDGAIAALFAFLSALLALSLMMRLLRSVSFTPYVVYRVVLGIILLVYAYSQ